MVKAFDDPSEVVYSFIFQSPGFDFLKLFQWVTTNISGLHVTPVHLDKLFIYLLRTVLSRLVSWDGVYPAHH